MPITITDTEVRTKLESIAPDWLTDAITSGDVDQTGFSKLCEANACFASDVFSKYASDPDSVGIKPALSSALSDWVMAATIQVVEEKLQAVGAAPDPA